MGNLKLRETIIDYLSSGDAEAVNLGIELMENEFSSEEVELIRKEAVEMVNRYTSVAKIINRYVTFRKSKEDFRKDVARMVKSNKPDFGSSSDCDIDEYTWEVSSKRPYSNSMWSPNDLTSFK